MSQALTQLTDVKAWCKVDSSNDDALLTRLITQASRAIYAYLTTNTLFLQTFTDTYDGVNNVRLILREWPVISVSSVYIDGKSIVAAPAQPAVGYGYRFESYNGIPPGQPQALDVYGYAFNKGRQNVYITYTAGYSISNEAATIPVTGPYTITVTPFYGSYGQNDGVKSATGVVFTAVTGVPAAGQYSVDINTGIYTFNAANANTAILISYSYVPADIEQACIEMVAERYFYKQRIGQKTKSLGSTETASYDLSAMSDYVQMLLQPYKRTNIL